MQITTPEEYHEAVRTHDARIIRRQLDAIPSRVNRAGKLYQKLVREIKNQYE